MHQQFVDFSFSVSNSYFVNSLCQWHLVNGDLQVLNLYYIKYKLRSVVQYVRMYIYACSRFVVLNCFQSRDGYSIVICIFCMIFLLLGTCTAM